MDCRTDQAVTVTQEIFAQLRAMLDQHRGDARVTTDSDSDYILKRDAGGTAQFRAALYRKPSDVKLHLFPVYERPELLDELSPDLRKRMQGKSCFNFRKADAALFAELAALIERAMRV